MELVSGVTATVANPPLPWSSSVSKAARRCFRSPETAHRLGLKHSSSTLGPGVLVPKMGQDRLHGATGAAGPDDPGTEPGWHQCPTARTSLSPLSLKVSGFFFLVFLEIMIIESQEVRKIVQKGPHTLHPVRANGHISHSRSKPGN